MKRKFYTLDVFTDKALTGNPLAVFIGGEGLSDKEMQKIAAELNLSETVFVFPSHGPELPESDLVDPSLQITEFTAKLRIFTPKRELPFAGHPTVGTAVLLAHMEGAEGQGLKKIYLEVPAGLIHAEAKNITSKTGYAEFFAPSVPEKARFAHNTDAIAKALALSVEDIGYDAHQPVFVKCSGNDWLFVPVSSLEKAHVASPRLAYWAQAIANSEGSHVNGIYVYTKGGHNPEAHYHVRMFAPDLGVPEDPATGSAAAAFPGGLAFFEKLQDGAHHWILEQGYEMGRPSQISVFADIKNRDITSVKIGGHAVLVSEGYFYY